MYNDIIVSVHVSVKYSCITVPIKENNTYLIHSEMLRFTSPLQRINYVVNLSRFLLLNS